MANNLLSCCVGPDLELKTVKCVARNSVLPAFRGRGGDGPRWLVARRNVLTLVKREETQTESASSNIVVFLFGA